MVAKMMVALITVTMYVHVHDAHECAHLYHPDLLLRHMFHRVEQYAL